MSFFDNLKNASSEAIEKVKDATETTQLNSKISAEDKKIKNLYFEIGEKYASIHKDDFEEVFKEHFDKINECHAKIEEYKQQIEEIKGIRHCEKCGAEMPQESIFCSSCGTALPEKPKEETPEPEEKVKEDPEKQKSFECKECEAELLEGVLFCPHCGTKQD